MDVDDGMGKAYIEVAGIGVSRGDRFGELVLLVLKHEGKAELVIHAAKVELRDHRSRDAIVETIARRFEAERDNGLGYAELVEEFERRRMDGGSALIGDRGRLLLEHDDRNSAAIERERADHPHRARADDDDAPVTIACGHAEFAPLPIAA
jgi:hypothetical protein